MDEALKQRLIQAQENELTEHQVYLALAARQKDAANREVLEQIAQDERQHYDFWAEYTHETPPPRKGTVLKFRVLARLLGLTFAVKLMEKGEEGAQVNYSEVAQTIPEAKSVVEDEGDHEKKLMAMISEERLQYVGSVVLGLSDALVELTGALAGLTLALQKGRLIAVIGLITGIAAALSMAASEYLSTKAEEGDEKSPAKAALYTGVAYLLTVMLLILPYMLLTNVFLALGLTILAALVIIFSFAYYTSVAQDLPLWRRFGEMAGLSLGVAAVSFGIGFVVRLVFGVEA